MNKRIDALAEQLAQNGLDWAVLNPGPSLRYLTGLNFHLMERPVVVLISSNGQVKIILPELEQARWLSCLSRLKSYLLAMIRQAGRGSIKEQLQKCRRNRCA